MLPKPPHLLLILPFLLLAPACGKTPAPGTAADAPPEVSHARILLPPPGGSMAAGYFEVRNPGAKELELRAVTSTAFGSVEMHETREEGGMSRMRRVETVAIPAGGNVSFEPGGKHLMLMESRLGDEKPVQTLPMSLRVVSYDGSERVLEVPFGLEAAGGGVADPHH